jgi:hypothetical protein
VGERAAAEEEEEEEGGALARHAGVALARRAELWA